MLLTTVEKDKLEITDVEFDGSALTPGGNNQFTVSIRNAGTKTVDSETLILCRKGESDGDSTTAAVRILPGETGEVQVSFPLPNDLSGAKYELKAEGGEEAYELDLSLTDLTVESLYSVTKDGKQLEAIVRNESVVPAIGILTVLDENGKILHTENTIQLDGGEEKSVFVALPEDVISEGQTDTILTLQVSTDSKEYYDFNNRCEQRVWDMEWEEPVLIPEEEEGNTYTISATAAAHGSITPSGDIEVKEGEDQSFSFIPEEGYEVDALLVDGKEVSLEGTKDSYTLEKISAAHSLIVSFKKKAEEQEKTYTITASAGAHGSITPSGSIEVPEGESRSFQIVPDEGYEIEAILLDGETMSFSENANSFTIEQIKSSHVLVVSFKKKEQGPEPIRDGLKLSFVRGKDEIIYSGLKLTPAVQITHDGKLLTEGDDYAVSYSSNLKAGQGKVVVSGEGNYTGKYTATFTIKPKSIAQNDTAGGTASVQSEDVIYVISGQKAAPVLSYDGYVLTPKDYTLSSSGKLTADTTLTIYGKGNFTGERKVEVKVIAKTDAKKLKVELGKENPVYDGTEKKPTTLKVMDANSGEILTQGNDYELRFPQNITDAGKIKFFITGKGLYSGSVAKTYTIQPVKVTDVSQFKLSIPEAVDYSPSGAVIHPQIRYGSVLLTEGKDYKLSFSANKKAGQGKYKVTFLGNYKGSKALSGTYLIAKAPLEGAAMLLEDKVYTGKPGTYVSAPIIAVDGVILAKSNYTVSYYDETGAEINNKHKLTLGDAESARITVKVSAKEQSSFTGDLTGSYLVRKSSPSQLSLAGAKILGKNGKSLAAQIYSGGEVEPEIMVQVKSGGNWIKVDETAYSVSYAGNTDKNTARLVVTAKTDSGYVGSKSISFKINALGMKELKE